MKQRTYVVIFSVLAVINAASFVINTINGSVLLAATGAGMMVFFGYAAYIGATGEPPEDEWRAK